MFFKFLTIDNDIGKNHQIKTHSCIHDSINKFRNLQRVKYNIQGFKLRKLLEVAFKQLEVKFRRKMEKVSLKSNLLFHLQSKVVGILGLTQFFSVAKPK